MENARLSKIPYLLLLISIAIVLTSIAYVIAEYESSFLFASSAAVLVLSFVLMNRISPVFNFTKITLPVFYIYTYLAMIYIPSFFIFFNYPGSEFAKGQFLLAVHTVLITVPLGALFANFISTLDRNKQDAFYISKTRVSSSPQIKELTVIALLVAAVFVFLFIIEVPRLPLIHVLKNPHSYVVSRVLRLESSHLLETRFRYFYVWLKAVIFPFFILLSWGNYLQTKEKFWGWVFAIALCGGLLYAMLDLQKMPAASILFTLVVFYLHYRRWKVNIPLLLLLAPILLLVFPYLVFWLISPVGEQTLFFSILEAIYRRLFIVPAEVTYNYFEIFPSVMDFLGGASSRTVAFVLGKEFVDIPKYVFKYWFGSSLLGHANACFTANAYADWGFSGVLFMGFFAGFLMQLGQIVIVRHGRSVLSLTLLSFFMFVVWLLNSIDLLVALNTHGVIIALGLFWILRRYERRE